MTMVMAYDQDVFLEKIKQEQDGLYYLYKDQWLKAKSRQEIFKVKDEKDVTRTIYETRHGMLLNGILTDKPRHELVPMPTNQSLGIAVSLAMNEPDTTMDMFFKMMLSKSLDE